MRKPVLSSLAALLALGSLPAVAADNGIYIGAGAGLSSVQEDELDYDADANGFKLIAGWRFIDWLAVEANYIDFGSGDDVVEDEKIEASADALSLSAVGFLPVGPVDLFARVGAVNWNADLSSPSFGSFRDDGTDLTYGLGLQFRLGSLGLRAEYEMFDFDGADVDMLSVGVTWTFF
jgi:hypothetical protein